MASTTRLYCGVESQGMSFGTLDPLTPSERLCGNELNLLHFNLFNHLETECDHACKDAVIAITSLALCY